MSEPKRIYGLIGYPVKHSLSRVMHNAAFKYLKERGEINYEAEYKLFEVKPEDLDNFLNSLAEENIYGLNVTIPHKVRTKAILEKISPFDKNARLILQDLYYIKLSGAVNTIKRINDELVYYNTDVYGFLQSLKDLEFEPKGKSVIIIGCGGAGRAIIAGLSWKNVGVNKIYINDINKEAFNSIKENFSKISDDFNKIQEEKLQFISINDIPKIIKGCNLLVNASPLGMKESDPCLIKEEMLHRNLFVYDLIYNPKETKLLKLAKKAGAKTSNGLKMLLYQGMSSFEIWTGKKAPQEVMWQVLSSQI